jgi:hypothetical protein
VNSELLKNNNKNRVLRIKQWWCRGGPVAVCDLSSSTQIK